MVKKSRPPAMATAQVVAANVRIVRICRRMSQADLAKAMQGLGHPTWSRAAVSEVERCGRMVNIDELASLAIALGRPVSAMFEPIKL